MRTLAVILISFLLFSCEEKQAEQQYLEGLAFGTTYHIQYYGKDPKDIKAGIDSVIKQVNQSASTYISDSDISRINQGDSTVVVDSFFEEVFKLSERIHTETSGYFDPTVGVLRNAYGFGDVQHLPVIDSMVLDSLMRYVGFKKVRLKADKTVHKEHPQIYFDFNAIAKGYGVDYIGKYLEHKGIENYLIELGGELLAKGENVQKKHPWTVGIETPDSDLENRSFKATVYLRNEGLAASGNYRKFRVDSASGKRFVHTVNPLTGSAEMSDVTSATVIAPTCGEADAYATSFMAMGFERAVALLQKFPQVEAYLTYITAEADNNTYISPGFKERMPVE